MSHAAAAIAATLILGFTTASYSSVCFLGQGWQGCQFSNSAPQNVAAPDPGSSLWGSLEWGTDEWSN